MIKYFCDKCNKEFAQSELYDITIFYSDFGFEMRQTVLTCKSCKEQLRDKYGTKLELESDGE